jgi:dihydrofolate reductase
MTISLIVAMTNDRVIGKNNTMPWHLPDDLRYFKATTLGKTIIMGRNTFESIGSKPLPNRRNIILSRTATGLEDVETHNSIESVLKSCENQSEIVVIGGSKIYQQFMDLDIINTLYLTQIHAEISGDCFFPAWDKDKWQETKNEFHAKDEKHAYDFSFITLKKVT